MSYSLNEPGRQNTSLYVLPSRVNSLRGLFLYEKLIEKDLQFFRPSQSVLQEERAKIPEKQKSARKSKM